MLKVINHSEGRWIKKCVEFSQRGVNCDVMNDIHEKSPERSLNRFARFVFNCSIFVSFLLLITASFSCMHKSPVRRETIATEIDGMIQVLQRNLSPESRFSENKIGKTGYFYLIDAEGTVLFHPQSALTGMSFSDNPLIKRIMEKKSGCIIQFFEGMNKTVFFKPAGNNSIICFTISTAEISGPVGDCENMK